MKTRIETFDDMSALDSGMLDEVIRHEREVYGYKGYGEYSFCGNSDCRRILSIDEIFGTSDTKEGYQPLDQLEKDGCEAPDCPDCGSPTIVIFNPQIYRPYLANLYRKAYGSLLIDENEAVRGTCVFQELELRRFFEENMNYKESMTWEEFRDRASKILSIDFQDDSLIVSTNRISVERPFRRGGSTFMELGRSTANIRPENDELPAFASVRYDGNVLPVLQGIGFKQIHADDFGTVAIGTDRLKNPRAAYNLSATDFMREFGPSIHKIVAENRQDKRIDTGPKYYKGATVLDNLQLVNENIRARIELLNEGEITDELLDEISDLFRELYNNAYGQYLFYPSAGEPISPQSVFDTNAYIPKEKLDAFDLNLLRNPETGELPHFWHDPETVRNRLAHLCKDGQMSIIRNANSSTIEAFTYGYRSCLNQAFRREEWRNPYNYSGYESPDKLRGLSHFVDCINTAVSNNADTLGEQDPFSSESQVYVWNQIGVMPQARRKGRMGQLTKSFFSLLSRRNDLPSIGLSETLIDSPIHRIIRKAGAIEVPGALDIKGQERDMNITLIVFNLKKYTNYFTKKY